MQTKPVRALSGLKRRGKALFKQITATYVLNPGESVLLLELCRTLDRLDDIDARLTADGLTIAGSRGQIPRAHPLLAALTAAQATASDLVRELALPLPGEHEGRRRTPQQKSAAVTALAFS